MKALRLEHGLILLKMKSERGVWDLISWGVEEIKDSINSSTDRLINQWGVGDLISRGVEQRKYPSTHRLIDSSPIGRRGFEELRSRR